MATAAELLIDACSDQISYLSPTQLWVVIAEALAQQVSMTAEELLDAACEDGISSLSETQLLIAIAEGINQGGGGGGGGTDYNSDGVVDPSAAPTDPTKTNTYTNTVAGSFWVWPAGGAAWQQLL